MFDFSITDAELGLPLTLYLRNLAFVVPGNVNDCGFDVGTVGRVLPPEINRALAAA